MDFDPTLDLELQRDIDVPVAAVWRAWTEPERLMPWFCPRPWRVIECEIDLRPGGRFRTVMQSPEGQNLPVNDGCYLRVEPERQLTWTNALGPGFRPLPPPDPKHLGFVFVADLRFEPLPNGGTRYRARVMHADTAARDTHAGMGFDQGWNIALDQLVEVVRATP